MDFKEATDALTKWPTHEDIARAAGVSVQSIRQARLAPDAPNYRRPPENWRQAVAKLARERARQLEELAARLERYAEE